MYGSNREVKEIDEDLINDYSTSWELCSSFSRMRMFKMGTLFDLFWNEGVQGLKWKISGWVLISSTYSFMWSFDLVDDSSKGMCLSARAGLVDSSANAQHVLGV